MTGEKEIRIESEEINIRKIFSRFASRWLYFILSLGICLVAGFLYMKLSLPVYEAQSSLLIKDNRLSSQGNIEDFLNGDVFSTSKNLSTEIGIIQSRSVLLEAASKLKLQVSYYGYGTISRMPLYKNIPFRVEYTNVHPQFYDIPFSVYQKSNETWQIEVEEDSKNIPGYSYKSTCKTGDKVSTTYFTLTFLPGDSPASGHDYRHYEFIINSDELLMQRIENNLKVSPRNKDATIINVSYRDNLKARAKEFLDALSAEYINRDINDKASVATLSLKFIEEQLAQVSKELASIEDELQKFKESHKTVDISEEAKNYLDRLSSIDADRMKARLELNSLDYLYNYVLNNKDISLLAPSSTGSIESNFGTPDPAIVQLLIQLQTLQSKRKNLSFGAKESSPATKIIDEQTEATKKLLLENLNNIRNRTNLTLEGINKELNQFENVIKKIPSVERDLVGIKRKLEVNQNIFVFLLQKKAENSIARATVVSDNKVLDEASVSDIPVKPSLKLVLLISILMAMFIPAFWILLSDYVQNKIMSRDEIEKLTAIPVIGIVGHMRETETRLVVHNKPKSSISEAFRSIRTNLAFFGMNEKNNVILITSSVGGEGKSFTAINLASVLALQNNKVIIVALDLRKSQLFIDFGVENKKGASTFLSGQHSLEEIIHHTHVPNLDFISSGPVPPNPAELISKDECEMLINTLKEQYDFVIVDTPPIGIVADALLLMKYSSLNIFILRQNYSRKENLKQINEYFRNGIIKHVSILFNDAGKMHSYGYGYGYYDEEHKRKKFLQRIFGKA